MRFVSELERRHVFRITAAYAAYEAGQWSLARDLYLQSLEEDSNFAPALARLARCYRLLGKWSAREGAEKRHREAVETFVTEGGETVPGAPEPSEPASSTILRSSSSH